MNNPITPEVLEATRMDFPLMEKLFTVRPDLVKLAMDPEGLKVLIESLKDNRLMDLRDKGGVDVMGMEDGPFLDYALNCRAVHFDLFTEDDWFEIKELPDSTTFVMEWVNWAVGEAWGIFSKDYEVKVLSSYTIGRWREFVRVWGEMTLAARQEVFAAYLESAQEDDVLELKWQVEMAAAGWAGANIQVPFVSNQREAASDETAVPRGADGKAKEV